MLKSEFEAALWRRRRGEITADAMIRETHARWRYIATCVFSESRRKWRLPSWVTVDDVLQAILMFADDYVFIFEEGRGVTLDRYVSWNAVKRAQKEIHRWRCVSRSGSPDRRPSRFESSMTSLQKEDETEEQVERRLPLPTVEPEQEDQLAARQFFDALIDEATSIEEVVALVALRASGGSLVHATDLLYGDPFARLQCRASTADEVGRFLRGVLMRIGAHVDTWNEKEVRDNGNGC